jgi:hypothetical protein
MGDAAVDVLVAVMGETMDDGDGGRVMLFGMSGPQACTPS